MPTIVQENKMTMKLCKKLYVSGMDSCNDINNVVHKQRQCFDLLIELQRQRFDCENNI